jgi:hypothetical protein
MRLPDSEGAVYGKVPQGAEQLTMTFLDPLYPSTMNWEGGLWSHIRKFLPFPAFIIHQDFLSQPWLEASPSVLPSSETMNNSLPSFILLLWSVTLSCSSRAFSFSRLYKFSSSPSFHNLPSNPLASLLIFLHFLHIGTGTHPLCMTKGHEKQDWRKCDKVEI